MSNELIERVNEISVDQAVLSTKVEGLENKVDCLDGKVSSVGQDVTAVKTDTGWIKKIVSILLVAIIGGAVTAGGKIIFDEISRPAIAKTSE